MSPPGALQLLCTGAVRPPITQNPMDRPDSELHRRLHANLERIRDRIAAAAVRAGRSPDEVLLVAVTKTVDIPVVRALVDLGQKDLAENRPQELWRKSEAIPPNGVRWHLVGHLQRNKVRRTLSLTFLIHSVDSLRLAEELNREAERRGLRPQVLLEVNMSREPQKHGFAPEEMEQVLEQIGGLGHLQVRGLMTMAAWHDDPEMTRPTFAGLRELRDRLQQLAPANCQLQELSMGMSHDFEVAVEEGATIVRIGTALFEGLHG